MLNLISAIHLDRLKSSIMAMTSVLLLSQILVNDKCFCEELGSQNIILVKSHNVTRLSGGLIRQAIEERDELYRHLIGLLAESQIETVQDLKSVNSANSEPKTLVQAVMRMPSSITEDLFKSSEFEVRLLPRSK